MASRVTQNLANNIHNEVNARCKEEAMNTVLFDVDCQIVGSRFEDGNLILDIKKRSSGDVFCLILKPVEWGKKQ